MSVRGLRSVFQPEHSDPARELVSDFPSESVRRPIEQLIFESKNESIGIQNVD
jgi:hypothetical protein